VETEAASRVGAAAEGVISRLKKHIFAYDGETLEGLVAKYLTEKGWTLAVAESCTGGLVTDRLTDIPGSSSFLERSVVTYSNAAKVDLLGVPADMLEAYGAVSEPTARRMAEGIRKLAGTDLGLAITGIAGPAGERSRNRWNGLYRACRREADPLPLSCFPVDRRRNKIISSQAALLMLKKYLTGEQEDG